MPPRVTTAQIAQMARARGLDPRAVLAVASREGLGGGVGDAGHAYGPFQLNNAGGVITGTHPGVNDPATQAWAWSPEGVAFALDRIAQAAKGQTGRQAVNSIVTRFERPANPAAEIAGALAAYGNAGSGGAGAVPSPAAPAAAGQPSPDSRSALMQALLGASRSGDYSGFFGAVKQSRQTQAAPQAQAATPTMTATAGGYGGAPGQVVGATQGEQPSFLKALAALAGYTGKPVSIRSGYRSSAEQAALYANRASNPNPVAPPGRSLHQQGLAADGTIGGVPLGTLPPALLARFGLEGVPGDPVHVQVRR